MVSGESTFITQVFAQSNNAYLALAHDSPGQVIPLYLGEKQYRLNDGAFLALDGTAYYTMETQSIGKALFGGQEDSSLWRPKVKGLFWPMLTVLLKNCAKQSRSDYW